MITRMKVLEKNLKLLLARSCLLPRVKTTLDDQSKRDSSPQHKSPNIRICPGHLAHSHHRLPKCVHLEHLLGPGVARHSPHLDQLGELRAELLVEQVDPSFNVMTASANNKERKGKEMSSSIFNVELNEINKYLAQNNLKLTEVDLLSLSFLAVLSVHHLVHLLPHQVVGLVPAGPGKYQQLPRSLPRFQEAWFIWVTYSTHKRLFIPFFPKSTLPSYWPLSTPCWSRRSS